MTDSHSANASTPAPYTRILLKLSGQSLAGPQGFGVHQPTLTALVEEIAKVRAEGRQVAIVVGAGNILRGQSLAAAGADRVIGDQMGMLATVMNCMALQSAFDSAGVPTRLYSPFSMGQIAERYVCRRARDDWRDGRIPLFGGGTGNPFFTTDSAAALRAAELKADVVLKATRVDGVYDRDPEKDPSAKRLPRLSHQEVIHSDLRVMDTTAVAICRDNGIPIVVFNLHVEGNILRVARGERIGTLVTLAPEDATD